MVISMLSARPVRFPNRILARAAILIAACVGSPTAASPLTTHEFVALAKQCGTQNNVETLEKVAAIESHFEPWAVRDNTTHETVTPPSLNTAITLAKDRIRKGHSVDVGLMQINIGNFASLHIGLEDAFDACHSIDAARRILQGAFAAGSSETERQAAVLIALSRYNTGRPLAGIANGYADRVIATQGALPTPLERAGNTPPQWNVWGASGAKGPTWVVTADKSSEIERAGAQLTEARAEGRAAVPPSKIGEPYELFAYQESEPNRP